MTSWAYSTLGIPESSSKEQVKTAYRKLAMKYHPDRGGDEQKFKQVQAAYDYLEKVGDHVQLRKSRSGPFNFGDGFTENNDNTTFNLLNVKWEDAINGTSLIKKGTPPGGHYLIKGRTIKINNIILPPGYSFKHTFQSNDEMFLGDISCEMSFSASQLLNGGWFTMQAPFDPQTSIRFRIPANTVAGKSLKISGHGYWNWKRHADSRGNLYILIQLKNGV